MRSSNRRQRRIASVARPAAIVALAALLTGVHLASERDLTFEQRVRAQEAIERVYHSHRVGATRPLDEAVPRWLVEKKVLDYLRQSAVLEQHWKTTVTGEALQRRTAPSTSERWLSA